MVFADGFLCDHQIQSRSLPVSELEDAVLLEPRKQLVENRNLFSRQDFDFMFYKRKYKLIFFASV